MKKIKFILLLLTIINIKMVYAYPSGFSTFIYIAESKAMPFKKNGNLIEFQSNCNVNNFPILGAGISCNSTGKLIVDNQTETTLGDSISTYEGNIIGLYAINENRNFMVQLDILSDNNTAVDCDNNDTLVLALSEEKNTEQVKLLVNSLIFKITLKVKTQGCEYGRPKVISYEVINCSKSKCEDSLETPLTYFNNINGKF